MKSLVAAVILPALLTGFGYWEACHKSPSAPEISCTSKSIYEGESVGCRGTLAYPLDGTVFRWVIKGQCNADPATEPAKRVGPAIRVVAPIPSRDPSCTLVLQVEDPASHVVGQASYEIAVIQSPSPPKHVTPGAPLPGPKTPSTSLARPPVAAPVAAPALAVWNWPNWADHTLADEAPVQGTVHDVGKASYKVAIYTLTGAGWSLQGTTEPDRQGKWMQPARFGSSYLAVLGSSSWTPEPKLSRTPKIGNGIIAVQPEKKER